MKLIDQRMERRRNSTAGTSSGKMMCIMDSVDCGVGRVELDVSQYIVDGQHGGEVVRRPGAVSGKNHSTGLSTSASAKSSNFKQPMLTL